MSSVLDSVSMPMMQLFTPVLIVSLIGLIKIKLVADLENDLQSVVKWDKKWLVNFNGSKTKLLYIKHLKPIFAFH